MNHTIVDFSDNLEKLAIKYNPSYIQTINVVASGGGVAGIYTSGFYGYLYELIKNNKIKLDKIYGTSSGAISSSFFLITLYLLEYPEYFNKYPTINNEAIDYIYRASNAHKKGIKLVAEYEKILYEIFPPDFYKFCTDKLFITVTLCKYLNIERKIIHKYYSNAHLINTIMCSCSVSYLTIPSLFRQYHCLDTNIVYNGFDGISVMIPKNANKNLLFINLNRLDYNWIYRFFPIDNNFEHLYLKGFIDTYRFFNHNVPCKTIYFKQNYKRNYNYNYYHKYKIIIINLLMFYCGSCLTK